MFKKILIANRGEIACRVMTTAKRLGVQTVAVYSQADADSRHVTLADEAFLIGPPPAAESYLRGDAIIECALKAGAEAIHPGYGFLSENPQFVADVEKAGLTFIGPSAEAIKAMGLKDSAKLLMEKANVPVVPGYHGDNQDPAFLAREAQKIGYPVLIKARAGGGGKGMRLVENPEEFPSNLESAQREAESSFGDPVCLIEKYISQPRHIEMQVFGDKQGNVVHLFERDFDSLISLDKPDELVLCAAALAALGFVAPPDEEGSSADPLFGWRHWSHAHHNITLQFEDSVFESIVSVIRHDRFKVACDGFVQELDIDMRADGGLNIQAGNHRTKLHVNRRGSVVDVTRDGCVFSFEIPDKTKGEDEDADAGDVIIAPMPGCVIALDAVKGAKVKAGERLMVLEAMKMEHALAASRDAIIEEVLVFVGDQVQDGALLVKLEPQDG